ncbi:non-ribosomal peptide synthetase/MFS transporter [Acrocarpospora catenulata]|uniref:non-ribosomal peptide synthetase/MFS transporter n=1 Tax=Acrocarpospora catenulata TaxID=2836182 RepID=UPI0027DEFABB|nr:non-ribosomal peptide synthetase [Acrocarpospora catenulata]
MSTLSADKRALLAQRLRRREETRVIPPRDPADGLVLSPAQERLWFLEQYRPGTTTYTVPLTVRIEGDLDPDAVEAALREITHRHEALRARFADLDGVPVVTVAEEAHPEFLLAEAASPEEARALIEAELGRTFDLAAGPLLRALLVRLAPADHVLLLAAHHLVTDGWSFDVILSELLTLLRGETPPPAAVQYGDYAAWQRGRDLNREIAYWRDRLAGVPALDLPTDRPRPPEMGHVGAVLEFPVPVSLAGLAGSGATPYMILLAAFQVLLGKYSGQRDFAVASPVAGRGVPELDRVVGMFVNTLAMRADLSGDPTFAELLARTRSLALDAYAHQELPFDRLVGELNVERDVSRSPIAQVTLALQNFRTGLDGRGLRLGAFPVEPGISRFDLSLYLYETVEGFHGQLAYNTDLFDRSTIERIARHFTNLLKAVASDPGRRLSELSLLDEDEHAEVLAFAVSGAATPSAALLHEVVAGPPSRVAVTCGDTSLTYGDLSDRSDALAGRLAELGVGPDVRVGICLEQSVDIAVAILAVLKAGGAYVPLDPAQPAARLAYLIEDAGIQVAITTESLPVTHTVTPDERGNFPINPAQPGDLAYVIYTSGTTGKPKGVAVQHRQILTYLAGARERLAVEEGGSYALLQSLSFDFGITIFYLSLMTGGTLHLLNPRLPAAELARTLSTVDYLKITPSHLASLLPEADVRPRKLLLLGGEAAPAAWAAGLTRPGLRVLNHYGPTEATVGVTTHEVGPDPLPVLPIGRPLPGARVYVLDERGEPTPIGVVGEVHLGGDRLARGYLGRPALTAERFLPDPYGEPGARMYRTGDLARRLAGGELQFLGRADQQLKVRGYRVEPAEIEAALTSHEAVHQAVVDLRRDKLVAYLVGTGEQPSLRAHLAELLPEYMIPARYVWLDELPLKAHGKVDKAALPDPSGERAAEDAYVAPATPLEEAVAEVWARVLELDRVGAEDDFFALGGHSLLAAQVVAKLRKVMDRPVTIMDIFRHRTVRALANRGDDGPRRMLHRLTPPRAATATLVCVPYGGGSAAIYQPLADAMPPGWALQAVAVPGQEWGLDEETRPIPEVADACVQEILTGVTGPVTLYGHCGLGVMLVMEIARRLEAAGRAVDAVHVGGIFPFARPSSMLTPLRDLGQRLRSDRVWANALIAAGLDVEELDEDQLRAIIRNRREGTREAEAYFTRLYAQETPRLAAPIISVVGERDPATEFYQERYREWLHLTGEAALVVLDEAGHFFLKHRAAELAEIVTGTRAAIADGRTGPIERAPERSWWLHGTATEAEERQPAVRPSLKRFGAVAAGQLVSIVGSALTEFAIPLWIYVTTGSLVSFALFSVIALVPGMLVAPLAGVVVDRYDRRKVMLAGDVGAGGTQLALGLLLWTGNLELWHIYPLLVLLSVALTFQRLAYGAAIPQLVPKRYLGHANGIVQMVTGTAQLIVPLVAVGLMAAIGLEGILVLDVASYTFAFLSVLLIRFPATLGLRRRETLVAEMAEGFRYTWGNRNFRAMLFFFAGLNIFLSPLFLLISPLVLAFATLTDVGRVSFAGGAGVLLGGLAMTVWGGPRRHRLRGVLLATLLLSVFCLVTGLRQDLLVIGIGAFGMSLALTLVNGIYATIVQVKVPQRFHGRVIALNTLIAWSTLPLAFGLVAPYGSALLEPLLAEGGALAGTVGAVIGTGPGRGTALLYLVFAAAIAVIALTGLRVRRLARFDAEVPDAPPDDLIGLEAVRRRQAAAERAAAG